MKFQRVTHNLHLKELNIFLNDIFDTKIMLP